MAKPNKNRQKFYDAYKNQHRREKNSERKKAKNLRHQEALKARSSDPEVQARMKAAHDKRKAEATAMGQELRNPPMANRVGGFRRIMDRLSYKQELEEREKKRLTDKITNNVKGDQK